MIPVSKCYMMIRMTVNVKYISAIKFVLVPICGSYENN